MFDWTIVIEIALFALIAVVVAAVVPWFKERVGAEKLNKLWHWVCWAVQAAEQIFGAGKGEKKKEYAHAYLDNIGVTAKTTPEQLDALIEAAVYELTPAHVYDETDGETTEE